MSKTQPEEWGFGFDPSINTSAWAVVSTTGRVHCGMIWNTYKDPAKDSWAKLDEMLHNVMAQLQAVMPNVPVPVTWTVEGQYTSRSKGSPDIQVRNGWISSAVYHMASDKMARIIALPQIWTEREAKEDRIEELKPLVVPPEEWEWHSPRPPDRLMHNIWDAIGLAIWGMKQQTAPL